jgi:exonuclease SbcC
VDDMELVAVTDSSFSPAAQIRGVWTPAEALSGGERTSLALAYRLALSRVVRSAGHLRLGSLLLDEPTDGFSPEQVESMGQLLEELGLPQILLVSHERELEGVAQRVVRVEKEDGRSVLRGPGTARTSGLSELDVT